MNHNFSLLALANILYSIQNGLQIDQALREECQLDEEIYDCNLVFNNKTICC